MWFFRSFLHPKIRSRLPASHGNGWGPDGIAPVSGARLLCKCSSFSSPSWSWLSLFREVWLVISCWIYHLVMTNSSPWKIHPFLSSVNYLFLWAIYTMAMLVITRGYWIMGNRNIHGGFLIGILPIQVMDRDLGLKPMGFLGFTQDVKQRNRENNAPDTRYARDVNIVSKTNIAIWFQIFPNRDKKKTRDSSKTLPIHIHSTTGTSINPIPLILSIWFLFVA